METKPKTLFDLLGDITFNKVKWEDQTQHSQKQFSSFMINRFLSMDHNQIELVNYIQQFSSLVGSEMTYKIYLDFLPKRKQFNKYIGTKTENKQQKLIDLLTKEHNLNETEVEQILQRTDKQTIIEEIKRYGYTEKQIKKEFNL